METISGDVINPHTVQKRLHWVRIKCNYHEVVYSRIDLPGKVFLKWMWFFRYRAALFQVQNPKANVQLEHGSVLAEIEQEEMLTHIYRQIKIQKGKTDRLIAGRAQVIKNWHELLPYSDCPDFKLLEKKIEDGIIRLFLLYRAIEKVNREGWSMKLWNEHYQ